MSRSAPKTAPAPSAPRPAVPPPPPAQTAADVPPAQAGEESVVPATPSSSDQVASPKEEVIVVAKDEGTKETIWRIRSELADLRSDNLQLRKLNTSLVVAFIDGKLKIRRNIDKKKPSARLFKFKEIEVDEEEMED